MMKNNNQGSVHRCVTLDEVQAYMNNTLSPAELEVFENKVTSCDECLELMESIQKGMLAEAIMQHEPNLASQEISTDYEKIWKHAKKQRRFRRVGLGLSAAASVIILLAVFWRLLPEAPQKNDKKTSHYHHTLSGSSKTHKDPLMVPDTSLKKVPPTFDDTASKRLISKKPPSPQPKKNQTGGSTLPKKQLSKDELYQLDVWEGKALTVVDGQERAKFLYALNDTIKYQKINVRSNVPENTPKLFLTVYDSTKILNDPVLQNIPFRYKVEELKVLHKLPLGTYYWLLHDADNNPLKQGKFRKHY